MDDYKLRRGDKTEVFLFETLCNNKVDDDNLLEIIKETLKSLNNTNIFLEKLKEILKTEDVKKIKTILKKGLY